MLGETFYERYRHFYSPLDFGWHGISSTNYILGKNHYNTEIRIHFHGFSKQKPEYTNSILRFILYLILFIFVSLLIIWRQLYRCNSH